MCLRNAHSICFKSTSWLLLYVFFKDGSGWLLPKKKTKKKVDCCTPEKKGIYHTSALNGNTGHVLFFQGSRKRLDL